MGLTRVHVVHSTPGRLGLRIDGLEKIKYFFNDNEDITLNLDFYKLKGINNIEFNPHTSKVLIEYDPAILREKQIIDSAKRLQELIMHKLIEGKRKLTRQLIDDIGAALKKEGYEMEKSNRGTSA